MSSTLLPSTARVKQGGEKISAINNFVTDGFLKDLHCLLLMDDTVIFATSREAMQEKLETLKVLQLMHLI